MKKITLFAVLFFLSRVLLAQDCSKYIFMQKGKVIESTVYDSGKAVRKSIQTVVSVTNVNGVLTAQVSAGSPNDKAKDKLMITFRCNGGALMMEVNAGGSSDGSQDIKMDYLEYPQGMKAGDHLKDVTQPFSNKVEGKIYKGTIKITDRIIMAKENVTTTAGTFTCYKITYKMTTAYDTAIMGTKVPPMVDEHTEWYSPEYGAPIKQSLGEGMMSEITSIK